MTDTSREGLRWSSSCCCCEFPRFVATTTRAAQLLIGLPRPFASLPGSSWYRLGGAQSQTAILTHRSSDFQSGKSASAGIRDLAQVFPARSRPMRRHRIGNHNSDQLGRTGQQKRLKDHLVLRSNPVKNRGVSVNAMPRRLFCASASRCSAAWRAASNSETGSSGVRSHPATPASNKAISVRLMAGPWIQVACQFISAANDSLPDRDREQVVTEAGRVLTRCQNFRRV